MLHTALKLLFTKFVIVLIVLPIPPSTIIGLAIIANPKTNQYLDQRALKAMDATLGMLKAVISWKVQKISEANQHQAMKYIK